MGFSALTSHELVIPLAIYWSAHQLHDVFDLNIPLKQSYIYHPISIISRCSTSEHQGDMNKQTSTDLPSMNHLPPAAALPNGLRAEPADTGTADGEACARKATGIGGVSSGNGAWWVA